MTKEITKRIGSLQITIPGICEEHVVKANDKQEIYAKESGKQISQDSGGRDLSFGPIDPEPKKIDLLPNEVPKSGH